MAAGAVELATLASRAEAYRQRGLGPATEETCRLLLQEARARGARAYEVKALRLMAAIRSQAGEVHQAIVLLREAEAGAGCAGFEEAFKVAYSLAAAYRITGDAARARECAREAFELAPPEVEHYRVLALLLQAAIAADMQRWEEALQLCREAERRADPADRRRSSAVWNHYGTIYVAMRDLERAELALHHALAHYPDEKPPWLAYSYTELGWVAWHRGDPATATLQANRALMLFLAHTGQLDRGEVARISHLYGSIAWADGDGREAVRHLARARRYYRALGSPHELEARALLYEVETSNRRDTPTDFGGRKADLDTLSAILDISDQIEETHAFLAGHSARVAQYASLCAERLGLNRLARAWLLQAARLHDAGLLTVNPMLLDSAGRLAAAVQRVMRQQPAKGAEIVAAARLHPAVVAAVRQHHENYDGSGGPDGIAGERISLLARIIRVAETYDALTSRRPQRPSQSHSSALATMEEEMGRQLCPACCRAFIEMSEGAPERQREEVSA